MNRRSLALLTALATIGVCSPVPLGADTFTFESKRDDLSPTPRVPYGGRPVSAGELLRMRRKNARKRR